MIPSPVILALQMYPYNNNKHKYHTVTTSAIYQTMDWTAQHTILSNRAVTIILFRTMKHQLSKY